MKKLIVLLLVFAVAIILCGCQARYDIKSMYIVRAVEIDFLQNEYAVSLVVLKVSDEEQYTVLSANCERLEDCFEQIESNGSSDLFYREAAAILVCGVKPEDYGELAGVLLGAGKFRESTPVYSAKKGTAGGIASADDPESTLEKLENGGGIRLFALSSDKALQTKLPEIPRI